MTQSSYQHNLRFNQKNQCILDTKSYCKENDTLIIKYYNVHWAKISYRGVHETGSHYYDDGTTNLHIFYGNSVFKGTYEQRIKSNINNMRPTIYISNTCTVDKNAKFIGLDIIYFEESNLDWLDKLDDIPKNIQLLLKEEITNGLNEWDEIKYDYLK